MVQIPIFRPLVNSNLRLLSLSPCFPKLRNAVSGILDYFTQMMFKIFRGGTSGTGADRARVLNQGKQPPAALRGWRFDEWEAGAWEFAQASRLEGFVTLMLLAVGIIIGAGCRTVSVHIPEADLSAPEWTVHQGQAVWHIPQGKREIAGDVMVATRADGQTCVQFTKSPFPLVIAQTMRNEWRIEFPPQNKHYSGRGAPPKRIIWLYLPRVLAGEPPPKNWAWKQDTTEWRLENKMNGEALEGYFD